MCGPWMLPLALMAGGSVAQFFGNQQAQSAQMRTFETERQRQQRFTQEQEGFWQDSLQRAAAMSEQPNVDAAAARRGATLESVLGPGGADTAYLPGSDSAAPVVRDAAVRADGERRAGGERYARSLARLGGFNDQLLDTNIMNARNAGRIGQTASFMRGSANTLDAELAAAAHKGSFLRGMGGLAQMIGQAMIPGGMGAGKAAAGPISGGTMSNLAQLFGNPRGNMSWAFGG